MLTLNPTLFPQLAKVGHAVYARHTIVRYGMDYRFLCDFHHRTLKCRATIKLLPDLLDSVQNQATHLSPPSFRAFRAFRGQINPPQATQTPPSSAKMPVFA